MSSEGCRKILFDFFHDRGVFVHAKKMQGMEVSRKPLLFVDYYAGLSRSGRKEMNDYLVSVFVGRDTGAKKFIPGVGIILTAILDRVKETGLKDYEPELVAVLRSRQHRDPWVRQVNYRVNFQRDWRYAIAIMNVLKRLKNPQLRSIAEEMACKARSRLFREKLGEIAKDRC